MITDSGGTLDRIPFDRLMGASLTFSVFLLVPSSDNEYDDDGANQPLMSLPMTQTGQKLTATVHCLVATSGRSNNNNSNSFRSKWYSGKETTTITHSATLCSYMVLLLLDTYWHC